MKPFGDGFIKLIKMTIAPLIFCTVVTGIAGMKSMKAVGKVGAMALIYFEIMSTIALVIGLVVINGIKPGVGMDVDPKKLATSGIKKYIGATDTHESPTPAPAVTTAPPPPAATTPPPQAATTPLPQAATTPPPQAAAAPPAAAVPGSASSGATMGAAPPKAPAP